MKDFNLEKRRWVLSAVAIGIIIIYLVRLFALQIMSDDYRKSADSNAFLKKIEFPSRGNITDRYGRLMVYNQPAYDIMVVMNEAEGRIDTTEFCNSLNITKEFFIQRMNAIKDRTKESRLQPFHATAIPTADYRHTVQCLPGEDVPFPRLLYPEKKRAAVQYANSCAPPWRPCRGLTERHRGRQLLSARRLHR